MNRIKLFTHTDLDGVSCGVIMQQIIRNDMIDNIDYCGYNDFNDRILNWLNNCDYASGDIVLITDISPSKDVADQIDAIRQQAGFNLQLLDHHSTPALKEICKKYGWTSVTVQYNDTRKACGTSLLYDYLMDLIYNFPMYASHLYKNCQVNIPGLICYVELVRLWDTFDWEYCENKDIANQAIGMSFVQGNIKREDFIANAHAYINMYNSDIGWHWFDNDFRIISDNMNKVREKVIRYENTHIIKDFKNYKMAVVFDDSYECMSLACNFFLKEKQEIDFIMVINMNRMAYEFRAVKDTVNLATEVANEFGGGGHPKAAGASITKENMADMVNTLIMKTRRFKL